MPIVAVVLFRDCRLATAKDYRWTFHPHRACAPCVSRFLAVSHRFMMYASGVATTAKWVLVVDDDEDNRDPVVEMLQGAGYIATAAPEGTSALRMMEIGARTRR